MAQQKCFLCPFPLHPLCLHMGAAMCSSPSCQPCYHHLEGMPASTDHALQGVASVAGARAPVTFSAAKTETVGHWLKFSEFVATTQGLEEPRKWH